MTSQSNPRLWPIKLAIAILTVWNVSLQMDLHGSVERDPGVLQMRIQALETRIAILEKRSSR